MKVDKVDIFFTEEYTEEQAGEIVDRLLEKNTESQIMALHRDYLLGKNSEKFAVLEVTNSGIDVYEFVPDIKNLEKVDSYSDLEEVREEMELEMPWQEYGAHSNSSRYSF